MNDFGKLPPYGDANEEQPVNTSKNGERGGNMLDLTRSAPRNITVAEIVSFMPKQQKERIISGYDLKNFAKIFEDAAAMTTVDGFLRHGMNVSETARKLYMHRNTLIYRLNKIQSVTGLDIRRFDMAVTFEILRCLYRLK